MEKAAELIHKKTLADRGGLEKDAHGSPHHVRRDDAKLDISSQGPEPNPGPFFHQPLDPPVFPRGTGLGGKMKNPFFHFSGLDEALRGSCSPLHQKATNPPRMQILQNF